MPFASCSASSPQRRGEAGETTWQKFIRLHVNTLVACDFFTKNVITPFGVRVAYCLAFIHVGTRKVFLSPPTYHPDDRWVQQQGRNMMMWLEDQQLGARFLIHDRDTKFSAAFRCLFKSDGIRCLRTPLLAPDAKDHVACCTSSVRFGVTLGNLLRSDSFRPWLLTGPLPLTGS